MYNYQIFFIPLHSENEKESGIEIAVGLQRRSKCEKYGMQKYGYFPIPAKTCGFIKIY